MRTIWLFDREILEKLRKTDSNDHHKVWEFNRFTMKYEIKPKLDKRRAAVIMMRDTANQWLKMWFMAFPTSTSEYVRSKA